MAADDSKFSAKLWDVALKTCVVVMPFLVAFAVWLTVQIYALKTEAALSKQQRETIVASMTEDRSVLTEIRKQQVQILIAIERLATTLDKEFQKKP